MKKIVLPTDFSGNAENAIIYALNLFKDVACVFYLLNTYMPSTDHEEYPWHTDLGESKPHKSMKKLAALLESMSGKNKNANHMFVSHSAMNTVVGEISNIIEKEGIDLIVMGTQGTTSARDVVFGSNTTQVVKSIERPVIAVPSDFTYVTPKKILFPTDYEINYSKEQFVELLLLAEHHQSHIAVMHVLSTSSGLSEYHQRNKTMLEKVLGDIDHRSHLVPNQDVRSAINDFQVNKNINFLVMVQNKHPFMERIFHKSHIKHIGLHIKVPFMVIPCLPKK